MNAKTLQALRGSIEKWEGIVAGTGRDGGPNNCPLCKLFWRRINVESDGEYDVSCAGCPVFEKTGIVGCGGTPYERYDLARDDGEIEEMKTAALAELNFLKSLLPK